MRVRCVLAYPDDAILARLGEQFFRGRVFGLTVGQEYVALGLHYVRAAPQMGTGAWVEVYAERHLIAAPLDLFEIVDPRVSQYWEALYTPDGALTLWPPSFFREYFHDDLSESVPEVVRDFRRVRALLESEFVDPA